MGLSGLSYAALSSTAFRFLPTVNWAGAKAETRDTTSVSGLTVTPHTTVGHESEHVCSATSFGV